MGMIKEDNEDYSISKLCDLLGVTRSTYYYEPVPESEFNLKLMRMIDEQYLVTPFYGSRRMTEFLKQNYQVNRKRIQRLMRLMGLEAMYPKPNLSAANMAHKKYPYLLKDIRINKPNQVWATDITYIPMEFGFLYLAAIMDMYSRYVIAWELSNSLEGEYYVQLLKKALKTACPDIHNSDKGCQYTSKEYIETLQQNGISISMTGRGRCLDNILVERLWRSVKYEDVYLKHYSTGKELYEGLSWYFNFYNNERLHQTLDYKAPMKLYIPEVA